jgi:hypothetical protein
MRALLFLAALLAASSMAHATDAFQFVAVGDSGRRITSRDGVTWSHDTRWAEEKGDLHDIVFAHGQFVAVGGSNSRGRIIASADGIVWRDLAETPERITAIAAGPARLVVEQAGRLLFSKDGQRFEEGAKLPWPGKMSAQHAVFGSGEGGSRFVFVGEQMDEAGDVHHWRATTEDGEILASTQLDSAAVNAIASGGGHFVVVGPGGLIESSHDGQQWTRCSSAHHDDFTSIVWDGKRFVVTSSSGTLFSEDGITWRDERFVLPCPLAWANHSMGALGFASNGTLRFSNNLRDWIAPAIPAGPRLRAIASGEFPAK